MEWLPYQEINKINAVPFRKERLLGDITEVYKIISGVEKVNREVCLPFLTIQNPRISQSN